VESGGGMCCRDRMGGPGVTVEAFKRVSSDGRRDIGGGDTIVHPCSRYRGRERRAEREMKKEERR